MKTIREMYREFPVPRILWLALLAFFPIRVRLTYEAGPSGGDALIFFVFCLVVGVVVPAVAAWVIYVIYLLPLGFARLFRWIDPIDDRRVVVGGLLAALIGAIGFVIVLPKSELYGATRPQSFFGSTAAEIVFWVIAAGGLVTGFVFALPRRMRAPRRTEPPLEGGT